MVASTRVMLGEIEGFERNLDAKLTGLANF